MRPGAQPGTHGDDLPSGLEAPTTLHANFLRQPYDYALNKDCETGVGFPSCTAWMGRWWLRPPSNQYSRSPVPMVPELAGTPYDNDNAGKDWNERRLNGWPFTNPAVGSDAAAVRGMLHECNIRWLFQQRGLNIRSAKASSFASPAYSFLIAS